MWTRPTVVQQGPTSIQKCSKRRNVETSLVCNFSAVGVRQVEKQETKRGKELSAVRRLYERLLFADLARQNESTSAAPPYDVR